MNKKHEIHFSKRVASAPLHLIILIVVSNLVESCTSFDLKDPETTPSLVEVDEKIIKSETSGREYKVASFRVKKENPNTTIYNSPDEEFLENWKKYSYMPESAFAKLEDGLTWTDQNVHLYVEGAYAMGEHFYQAYTNDKILYTYEAAQKACKKIGPEWRLPINIEVVALLWTDIKSFIKPDDEEGKDFYHKHIFKTLIEGGSSSFSFPLPLPGFGHLYPNGHVEFNGAGRYGGFWTTDNNGNKGVIIFDGTVNHGIVADQGFVDAFNEREGHNHDVLASCRCIKDSGETSIPFSKSLDYYQEWFNYSLPSTFFKRLQDGHVWTIRDVNLVVSLGGNHTVSADDSEKSFEEKRVLYTFKEAERACEKIGPDWQIPEIKDVENLLLLAEPSFSPNQDKFDFTVGELLSKGGKTNFSFETRHCAYKEKGTGDIYWLEDMAGAFWVYDNNSKPKMVVFDVYHNGAILNTTIEKEEFTINGKKSIQDDFLISCRCINKSAD